MKKIIFAATVIFLIVWIVSTQLIRWLLLFAWGIFVVICFIKTQNKKSVFAIVTAVSICIVILGSTVFQTNTETFRFTILQNAYEANAQRIAQDLSKTPGMSHGEVNTNYFLASTGTVLCYKAQDHLVLYYEIAGSFFNNYGILYVSSGVGSMAGGPFPVESVDHIVELNPHWAYVKLY